MGMFNRVAEEIARRGRQEAVSRVTREAGSIVGSALANVLLPLEAQKAAAFGGIKSAVTGTRARTVDLASAVARFEQTGTPCLGGVTPSEAREIFQRMSGQTYAKKNLWVLEISSRLNSGQQNVPDLFNLFATNVSYTPTITGDATKIGAANYDTLQGIEPVELSVTTYDDREGTLKKWFSAHLSAAVASDGTVSEPDTYAITVKIIHGYVNRKVTEPQYENVGLFRPVSMELSLDRHEDGLEEITMQFAQLDTFMRP